MGGTGNWDDPAQWAGGVVPGVADKAIINSGTVTTDNSVQVDGLTLNNGILNGSGEVRLTGSMEWQTGVFAGTGKVVIESGAVAHWTGANDKRIIKPMDNLGTVNWDSGRFVVQSAEFNNLGEFNVTHDGQVVHGGDAVAFNNLGTFNKTSSGTVSFSNVPLNNSGTFNWVSGNLLLDGGGENTTGLEIPVGGFLQVNKNYAFPVGSEITGAGEMRFAGGTQTIQGTYTVSGPTVVSGGAVNFENEVSLGVLQFNNGTIGGAGMIRLTGLMEWQILAGAAMSLSSVSVIANALRVRKANL